MKAVIVLGIDVVYGIVYPFFLQSTCIRWRNRREKKKNSVEHACKCDAIKEKNPRWILKKNEERIIS